MYLPFRAKRLIQYCEIMSMFDYKFVKIILILAPIIFLGIFSYKYINPSGLLVVDYDFCDKETAYFSGLSPHGRVLDIHNCSQILVIDPVYFDIRLPQSYRQVELEVSYTKSNEQELKFGSKQSAEVSQVVKTPALIWTRY